MTMTGDLDEAYSMRAQHREDVLFHVAHGIGIFVAGHRGQHNQLVQRTRAGSRLHQPTHENGRTLHAHAEREDTEGGLHVCIPSRNRCLLSQWSCGELKRASTTAWLDSNSSHCNFLRLAAKHCRSEEH